MLRHLLFFWFPLEFEWYSLSISPSCHLRLILIFVLDRENPVWPRKKPINNLSSLPTLLILYLVGRDDVALPQLLLVGLISTVDSHTSLEVSICNGLLSLQIQAPAVIYWTPKLFLPFFPPLTLYGEPVGQRFCLGPYPAQLPCLTLQHCWRNGILNTSQWQKSSTLLLC